MNTEGVIKYLKKADRYFMRHSYSGATEDTTTPKIREALHIALKRFLAFRLRPPCHCPTCEAHRENHR